MHEPTFITVFVFLIICFFGFNLYKGRLSPKFINEEHRQLHRERDEARRQHKSSKYITNKIKALVRADLERNPTR